MFVLDLVVLSQISIIVELVSILGDEKEERSDSSGHSSVTGSSSNSRSLSQWGARGQGRGMYTNLVGY